jgi:hypothetical protein
MRDTFRKECNPMSLETKAAINEIKEKAEELESLMINLCKDADIRYMSLAKTSLEQCVMWAVKAIT